MNRRYRILLRVGQFLPALMLYQAVGCLPNNAFSEVFAENIVFTSAIVIQSITSIIFSTFLPIF